MNKKTKKIKGSTETIHVMDGLTATLVQKERFNAFQSGTGVHKNKAKEKMNKEWKKEAKNFY